MWQTNENECYGVAIVGKEIKSKVVRVGDGEYELTYMHISIELN